jgi:peptide/nickel transport system permease protein
MIKFIARRLALMLLTMFIVSVIVFVLVEMAPGNLARNVLGQFATAEQEAAFLAQHGLDRPFYIRYVSWLLGTDWQAERITRLELVQVRDDRGRASWWAAEDDGLVRWKMEERDLVAIHRFPDGTIEESIDNERWRKGDSGNQYVWAVDQEGRAVKFVRTARVVPTGGIDLRFSDGTTLSDFKLEDRKGRPAWPDGGTPVDSLLPANEWVTRRLDLSALTGKTIDEILLGLDYRGGTMAFPFQVSVFLKEVRITEEDAVDSGMKRFTPTQDEFSGEFLASGASGEGELAAAVVEGKEAGVATEGKAVFEISGRVTEEQGYVYYTLFQDVSIPIQETTELSYDVLYSSVGEVSAWEFGMGGWIAKEGGSVRYIPLNKGFLRGDPGRSIKSGRPVGPVLVRRLRNSLVLAGIAFITIMPVAVALGVIAGLNNGGFIDRFLSLFGLITTSTPVFATGVVLVLVLSSWLGLLPGATVYASDSALFENPEMLVLPVLTLALIELGYVLRITRSSVVEVMREPYIQTASLKGLPYHTIVLKHMLRNALIAPLTVILLHVNWLIGGIVVVEAIFGFPGLGKYLYDSALSKDVFAIEAGAMVMVVLAVSTQLVGDIAYSFLNPRIRYGEQQ